MKIRPNRPLRILYVLEYFALHIGGVETLFDSVTRSVAKCGHPVTVVTLRVPGTGPLEIRNGVTIRRIRTPRWARRGFFTFLAIPYVLRHAFRADIINAATPNAAPPARPSTAITGTRCIYTVHEVYADLLADLPAVSPLRAWLYR